MSSARAHESHCCTLESLQKRAENNNNISRQKLFDVAYRTAETKTYTIVINVSNGHVMMLLLARRDSAGSRRRAAHGKCAKIGPFGCMRYTRK